MDKNQNLNFIYNCGDEIQLEFGTEFGYYAKLISPEKLNAFCEKINENELIYLNEYRLSLRKCKNGQYLIYVANYRNNLEFPIKLLDHSIYFILNSQNWEKIDNSFFNFMQKSWIEFLKQNIQEYNVHMYSSLLINC